MTGSFFNAKTLAKTYSLLLLIVLLTGCYTWGTYRYGGKFQNVQLPVRGKKLVILNPRGFFGDEAAAALVQKTVSKAFRKCPTTSLITEAELNQRYEVPRLNDTIFSEADLQLLMKYTDLDYLVMTDVGPGQFEDTPLASESPPADREASVLLIVYDLADGSEFKAITVTGTLMLQEDLAWYVLEYDDEQLGQRVLKKVVKRLARFSDCG